MIHTTRFPRLRALLFGLVSTVLVLGATAGPAHGQSASGEADQIRQMLEDRDQEIKSILRGTSEYTQQQREELKALINGVLDFRAMGRTALGPFWEDLSDDQRSEFLTVFQDVVRTQSLSDLEVYNSKVTYDAISVDGDSAFVRTTTAYQGTSTPVEYVLHREDSTWLAKDIIVDDVSTAESYARSYQTFMRKRGFDALMNVLRKKRDNSASGSQSE
jgi:phospholipid transport system substrate-binding protein